MNKMIFKKNTILHLLSLLFIFLPLPIMISCAQNIKDRQSGLALANNHLKQKKIKQLIVIDPGHGGFDIGATVQGVEEKALALQMATLVKKFLHNKGYRVILSRSRDVFIPLTKRTQIANDTKSKLFVSIHFNSFKETSVKGIEIFFYNKGSQARKNASKKLAKIVLEGLITATETQSRGVKSGNFHVIRETNMPAILIEGGFLTNPQERNCLKDKKYIEKMAQSIANGIDKYLKS